MSNLFPDDDSVEEAIQCERCGKPIVDCFEDADGNLVCQDCMHDADTFLEYEEDDGRYDDDPNSYEGNYSEE